MIPEEYEQFSSTPTCTYDLTEYDYVGYPVLGGVSRTRFLQGYYRAMTMIYLTRQNQTRKYRFLASMHLLDFFRMLEVMEWIVFDYVGDIFDEGKVLPGYDSLPRDAGEDTVDEQYDKLWKASNSLSVSRLT